jgi:hypothetical protein
VTLFHRFRVAVSAIEDTALSKTPKPWHPI